MLAAVAEPHAARRLRSRAGAFRLRGAAAALGIFTAALLGCSDERRLGMAERLMALHFESVRRGDFEAAVAGYSQRFFDERLSRDEWIAALGEVHAELGDYLGRELVASNVWTTYGIYGLGSYVLLHYKVRYAEHHSGHLIYVFMPLPWGEPGIVRHQIFAPSLGAGSPAS